MATLKGDNKTKVQQSATPTSRTKGTATPAATSGRTKGTVSTIPKRDDGLEEIRSLYSSLDQNTRRQYASTVQQALVNSAASYNEQYNNLLQGYQAEAGRQGYRSGADAAGYRDRTTAAARELTSQRDKYAKLMDIFGEDMDEDFRTEFTDFSRAPAFPPCNSTPAGRRTFIRSSKTRTSTMLISGA